MNLASELVCPIDFQPVPFQPASSSVGCPQPQLIKQPLILRQLIAVCESGMETQNVLIMSVAEEGWGDPGLLSVLLLLTPHGSAGALKPALKPRIKGSPHPVSCLPFLPPPHSKSQQRMKPETGANGIQSSPCWELPGSPEHGCGCGECSAFVTG